MATKAPRTGYEADVGPKLGNVLVATDFSTGARAALDRLGTLPLESRVRVQLVHVAPSLSDGEASKRLASERRLARGDLPRTAQLTSKLLGGRVVPGLVEAAKAQAPELILLGRHGAGRLRELLIGSTAERLLYVTNRPLLVVARTARRRYRHAVLAVDLEPGSVELGMPALRLMGIGPEALTIVHVAKDAADVARARGRLAAQLAPFPSVAREAHVVIRSGDPRRVVQKVVKEAQADLLVVGTHGRTGLEYALIGSVAQDLVRRASCDVLVVPNVLS